MSNAVAMIFLTAGAYVLMLIGLAVWSGRRARREGDETSPATERCPRCRGLLGVVEIYTGRGQLLCCSEGHRWEVRVRPNGARVLMAAPAAPGPQRTAGPRRIWPATSRRRQVLR